jgi:hypothetical protein
LELFGAFFSGEGDVTESFGDFLDDGVKHEISSVIRIEMSTIMTRIMSS